MSDHLPDSFTFPITVSKRDLQDIVDVFNNDLRDHDKEPNLTIEEVIETPELFAFFCKKIRDESRLIYDPDSTYDEGEIELKEWEHLRSICSI